MSDRTKDGQTIHDGTIYGPARICPRGLTECSPLSRCASPNFASYFCVGETDAAPVPTDRLRFCVFSSHDNKPVDVMVNFDERDATDAAYTLLGGLSAFACDRANGIDPYTPKKR
ncbi:MAG: hypothetical protein ACR652_24490 [Methylocystis sp.]|uniref:hypothetical protein n=1 Tax=Methylocystis sp. TaxID=1911079 RepID=UPI003DA24D78